MAQGSGRNTMGRPNKPLREYTDKDMVLQLEKRVFSSVVAENLSAALAQGGRSPSNTLMRPTSLDQT